MMGWQKNQICDKVECTGGAPNPSMDTHRIAEKQPPSEMHLWCVRVRPRSSELDGHARDVLTDVHQLGLAHIERVHSSKIYFLAGELDAATAQNIAAVLLTDPVAEEFEVSPGMVERQGSIPTIEVHPLPGVMNPVALSALQAARKLLATHTHLQGSLSKVETGRRYEIVGAQSANELERIASQILSNSSVERWFIDGLERHDPLPSELPTPSIAPFELRHVSLRSLNDDELKKLSRTGHLFLSLPEMQTIQQHYQKLDRDPTDLELESLAQTWSEHCVHKTFKSEINYKGDDFGKDGQVEVHFGNLLKDTIAAATFNLDRDWCLSVFEDNAGVIAFDDDYGIAFKAETHNHPSAIEPYGGAATGIGGCIRDIMGCGLGAKPIASMDVFCLAPPDFDESRLPKDVIHPRRTLKGVVGGVRDYGNRMGIPTVGGAIYFDERYLANPLVFCGCVGLIPRDKIDKQPNPGDFIVVAGGKTGRDGIHGATFSSAELTDTHADEFSHAVQIGNAIEEKKVLDAQLLARDHPTGCLFTAVTDCGAGGLSSAVGEMGILTGASVDLEKVPLKYAGLRYDEIWISEAQERMVFAVAPENLEDFLAIFAAEEVEATTIGQFTSDKKLTVRYNEHIVGQLDMQFLHEGLPKAARNATWSAPKNKTETAAKCRSHEANLNPTEQLFAELSELNTASKEWVIRQYDHEVQGRSVIKPLVGPEFGPSDAAVLRPRYDTDQGLALACGLCPELSDIDPYWMAIAAVDEALRNAICVGGNPRRTAILDNFCWPGVDSEESLGALVRACRGAYDAAMAYGLPFVSGKDSLNNEFSMSPEEAKRTGLPKTISIPPTLLISAVAIVEDVNRCVSMNFKTSDHCIAIASAPVNRVGLREAMELHHKVSKLICSGKVAAAHDVSDGGLAVSIAEMCIASGLGATCDVASNTFSDSLFDPISTTYLLEMPLKDAEQSGFPIIGRVCTDSKLTIHRDGSEFINAEVCELSQAWREPLQRGGR